MLTLRRCCEYRSKIIASNIGIADGDPMNKLPTDFI